MRAKKKKAVRAKKKRFQLVPKAATARMLKALDMKVELVGASARIITIPRGGCLLFSPPCLAAAFFKKKAFGL